MSAISQQSAAGSFDISGPEAPAHTSNDGPDVHPAGSWQQAAGIFSAISDMLSSDLTTHGADRQNRADLIQKLDELETTLRNGGSSGTGSLMTELARLETELRVWHGIPREDKFPVPEPVPEPGGKDASGVAPPGGGTFEPILEGGEGAALQPAFVASAAASTLSNHDGSTASLEQFDRLALTIGDSLAKFGVAKAHAALGERRAAENLGQKVLPAASIDPRYFDTLTKRIEASHRQLAARLEAGLAAAAAETISLKNLIAGSTEQIEQSLKADQAQQLTAALEREIANLAQRLDGAGEGLAALPSLEQTIASLSVQLEETRRIANGLMSPAGGERPPGSLTPLSEHGDYKTSILREISDLRILHEDNWQRVNLVLAEIQNSVEQIAQAAARGADLYGSSYVPSNSDPFAPILTSLAQHGQDGSLAAKVIRPGASDKENLLAGEAVAANSVKTAKTFQLGDAAIGELTADGSDAGAPNILIEPGLGFPGRSENIEPHGQGSGTPKISHEREEGVSRADFIAAARRAARMAQKELQGGTAPSNIANESIAHQGKADDGMAVPGALQFRRGRGFLVRYRRSLVLGGALLFAAIGAYALSSTFTHKSLGDFVPEFLMQFDRGGVRPSPAAAGDGSGNKKLVSQTVPGGSPPGQSPASQSPPAGAPGVKALAASPLSMAKVPLDPLAPTEPGFSANGAARVGIPVAAGNPALATRAIAGSDAIVADTFGRTTAAGQPGRLSPPAAMNSANALQVTPVTPAAAAGALAASPSAEPVKNLLEKAKSGDAAAQFDLALRYAEGSGSEQSYELAAQWYGKAAEQGLAMAEYRLATLYERGLGVGKDTLRAKNLYQRAAEKGNIRAMHNLGVLAVEGTDGKPNYTSAALWFGKAAEYGIRDSQYNLAVLLARGLGLPKDLVSSYTWFAIVAAAGDTDAAKKRDEVAARLTSSELAAANAAVAAFEPRSAGRAANEAAPPAAHHEPAPAMQGQPVKPKVSGL